MKKSFLNKEDYLRILQTLTKWPNWQKEYANEQLLVSKHAVKLPFFVDDCNKVNCQNTMYKKANT